LSVINPHLGSNGSMGRSLRRVGNEWRFQQQQQQPEHEHVVVSKCSPALACSILVLMLGDAAAQPILSKYNNDHHYHPQENSWKSILGPRPTLAQFQRPPLPVHIASRGVDFIRDHFKPSLLGHAVDNGVRLFVDLAVAIQDPRRHGAYWGIQLIQPLFIRSQKLLVPHGQGKSGVGMSDKPHDEDSWTSQFHEQCLMTARAVLSTVPEADVLQLDPRLERRTQQEQQPQVHEGGVHPFGPRGDLNRLLADHRVSRKKRRLQSDGALQARQTAYNMIAELCSSSNISGRFPLQEGDKGNVGHFDLPSLIFQCAASEENSLQPLVAQALERLLLAYKKLGVNFKNKDPRRQQNLVFVAPLLPSLICAASADSTVARLAVARWCGEFLAHHDPDAALYICHYLSNDTDTYISNMATKTIPTLRMLGTSSSSSSSSGGMALPVILLDTKQPAGVLEIHRDVQQRVQHLTATRFPHLPDCMRRSEISQILLQDFRYSVSAVEEALELNYEGTIMGARVSCNINLASDTAVSKEHEFICGICYDETLQTQGFALPCGHRYCFPCWRSHLVNILEDGAANSKRVAKATCPEQACGERILTRHVNEIHSELSSQWEDAILAHFVELDKSYRPCPGPDCKMVAHVLTSQQPTSHQSSSINCTHCHTSFCFDCGGEPHQPAKCSDFTAWNAIFGSSEFWVKKHAKPCPSCGVPIEKNDGCNHMKCSRCSTDFCWLCLSPMYHHLEAHTCNRFDPTTIADNDEQRRALFYTDRYQAHDDAELYVKDRIKTLDYSLAKLTERFWFVTDEELEVLSDAVESLAVARRFLKYSYVTAWAKGLDVASHQRRAYECHQATLELVTERLSNMTVVKWDDLYSTQGERGVRRFFGAISFHTSCISQYMTRLQLLEEDEGTEDANEVPERKGQCTNNSIRKL
jgi:IBR domain, a half RING-finger domain/Zinc finger, C3HC4 type (RING finger)